MTIDPLAIEDAVVALVAPALAAPVFTGGPFVVEAYGDDAQSYIRTRMAAAAGAVLIGFAQFNRNAGPETGTEPAYDVALTVVARSRRPRGGHASAYPAITACDEALHGARVSVPASGGPRSFRVAVGEGRFVAQDGDLHVYALRVRLTPVVRT